MGTGVVELVTGCTLFATGPPGWAAILGASAAKEGKGHDQKEYTWDCWKPLLHDKSPNPSKGRVLKDVLCDARIKCIKAYGLDSEDATKWSFVVQNVWHEAFSILPVILSCGSLAFHAVQLS